MDTKRCAACRQYKDRFEDFNPRWNHLPKNTTRQPRCIICDRERSRRNGRVQTIKRIVVNTGKPASIVKVMDPDTKAVYILDDCLPKSIVRLIKAKADGIKVVFRR
jgi:hypothetical protein